MTALSLENFFWCSFKVSAAVGDLAPKDFAKTRFYQERDWFCFKYESYKIIIRQINEGCYCKTGENIQQISMLHVI